MLFAQPQISNDPSLQNLESRIQPILEEIAEALWTHRDELTPNLASGLAGAALFLGYLSRRPGFEVMKERAHELLALAIDRVEHAPTPSLYSGFVGLAWCVEHLNGRILEAEEGDPNADVDEILLEMLQTDTWTGDYDLISGLVGMGVYALERLPRPSGRKILERILDHLERLAIPRGPGLAWPTPPEHLPKWQRDICPQGYLNLGLAHGIPGVLALLAAIRGAGIAPERASRLLNGGVAWLSDQAQPPSAGVYLAGWCPMEQERPVTESGRIAWCYGDLGASVALLNAARLAQEPAWESLAVDMARLAANRPLEDSGVKDISLCHGSAGNLHIFNRLHQITGEDIFRKAAFVYLQHVLDSQVPGKGFAGFTTYFPATDEDGNTIPGKDPYIAVPGLLEGATGVGLALLSCLENEDQNWDRFMLLSTPLTAPSLS